MDLQFKLLLLLSEWIDKRSLVQTMWSKKKKREQASNCWVETTNAPHKVHRRISVTTSSCFFGEGEWDFQHRRGAAEGSKGWACLPTQQVRQRNAKLLNKKRFFISRHFRRGDAWWFISSYLNKSDDVCERECVYLWHRESVRDKLRCSRPLCTGTQEGRHTLFQCDRLAFITHSIL